MSAHTPGPWQLSAQSVAPEWLLVIKGEVIIANVNEDLRQEANARLMAAAPDLLAALEAVLADVQDIDNDHALTPQVGRQVRAAILKAKGELS